MEPQQNNTHRPKQTIQPMSHDLEETKVNTVETPASLYPTASNDFSDTFVESTAATTTTPEVASAPRPHIRRIFAGLLLVVVIAIIGTYLFAT